MREVLLVVLVAVGACGSSGATLSGAGGMGGSGAGDSGQESELLAPDPITGWVDEPVTKIHGQWWADADGLPYFDGRPGDCQAGGHNDGECSTIIGPDATIANFPSTSGLGMCVVGLAAKVIAGKDGKPDYHNIYGGGIGFPFNDEAPYDAVAHGVTGIAFDIDTEPPPRGGIRVELGQAGALDLDPFWGGDSGAASPVHAGHNEFRWMDVGGYVTSSGPRPFPPSTILGLDFWVKPDVYGPKAFSFCISNVVALQN